MKRIAKLLAVFLFSFNCVGISAQIFNKAESPFHISAEPLLGYKNGVLEESIYRSLYKNSKISLLEWEENYFFYGINLKTQYKNLHFDLGVTSSFPEQKSGEMKDSDWQNTKDFSMKTTYSVGTNFAEKNYCAKISLYYDFFLSKRFFISPKIQAQYNYDSFYRKKGAKGWYGHAGEKFGSTDGKNHWWYEEEARKYPYYDSSTGKTWNLAGIDYMRHSVYIWTGISAGFRIENLCFDLGFMISPFTYFSAEDRHHTGTGEDNVYHEIQQDYFTSIKFSGNCLCDISKSFAVGGNVEWLYAANIKGDFYLGWAKSEQPSGASAKDITFSLFAQIKFW